MVSGERRVRPYQSRCTPLSPYSRSAPSQLSNRRCGPGVPQARPAPPTTILLAPAASLNHEAHVLVPLASAVAGRRRSSLLWLPSPHFASSRHTAMHYPVLPVPIRIRSPRQQAWPPTQCFIDLIDKCSLRRKSTVDRLPLLDFEPANSHLWATNMPR